MWVVKETKKNVEQVGVVWIICYFVNSIYVCVCACMHACVYVIIYA